MSVGGAVVRPAMHAWRAGICAILCVSVLSCGGGDGNTLADVGSSSSSGSGTTTTTPAAANVVAAVVDAGPSGSSNPDVNTLFTTIKICVPGSTTNCQTISHIQIDTASFGLRLLSSALTVSLPVQQAANGNPLVECVTFVDGFSWGPVALADVTISGETASSLPVQVIGSQNFTNIPTACSGTGNEEDTVATFGANGILGVGVFAHDCGTDCASNADYGNYYACNSTECDPTTVAVSSQVANPVTFFATDNNGVIIQLPTVDASGAATVSGSLIFGIDTASNNASGSQTILTVDPIGGEFTTRYNGQTFTSSFLDTGSNGYFFNDGSIAQCTDSVFYCPATTLDLTATLQGQNGNSTQVSFSIADADTLGADDSSLVAFSNLGGPFPGLAGNFDWGLPFYYGRTVYTAIENATTSVGTGPYIAF